MRFDPDGDSLVYNVEELAWVLSMSRGFVYKMVKEEKIPYIRIGRSVRFPKKAIGEWVKNLPTTR